MYLLKHTVVILYLNATIVKYFKIKDRYRFHYICTITVNSNIQYLADAKHRMKVLMAQSCLTQLRPHGL